jgi:hypothetical protein
MHSRSTARLIAISALTGAMATVSAPPAMADTVANLTSAVDQVRSASRCQPLQSDPLVLRVSEMATQRLTDFISHRTAEIPIDDPMPALKTIGYPGTKATLVGGYGADEAEAIHGLLLEGRVAIPDCSYTQYGVSTAQADDGFYLTTVILAAP